MCLESSVKKSKKYCTKVQYSKYGNWISNLPNVMVFFAGKAGFRQPLTNWPKKSAPLVRLLEPLGLLQAANLFQKGGG